MFVVDLEILGKSRKRVKWEPAKEPAKPKHTTIRANSALLTHISHVAHQTLRTRDGSNEDAAPDRLIDLETDDNVRAVSVQS